jgi:hypothetical protein
MFTRPPVEVVCGHAQPALVVGWRCAGGWPSAFFAKLDVLAG